ncbi:hypothetical protein COY52_06110 [Candidatus Desantisbacteria bacterium CG_4_10_14_0_8_um_filter_48_22]|uniref:HepT-like domain-containing protein n=1 Tax=Candidatus Desantisbacteria bacterium CG_4_10_14_0_8_um_filter_48_22 TaxID=1974543 RepID=A0A2M7SB45_9BACT|nr:MAG: hypothetical protein COS16_07290 [Candidatus Desantisbacteria bacterium CG02_land_8_20_14_3_00_49_13]PIZ16767.1 MAG: hypothetical protein COY52_06110 [Candidatus Desantisbacteria bacterium CG_4_10_14_0_8_um_filter_48_22]
MSVESQKLLRVKSVITNEIKSIMAIETDLKKWKSLHGRSPGPFEIRAAGSLLQDFYNCIERIFEMIGRDLNGGIPASDDWHKEILNNMAMGIEKVRPAVISENLKKDLNNYLKFRHLFRNIYGAKLEWSKMEFLVSGLPEAFKKFEKEIKVFCRFLDKASEEIK